MYDETPFLSVSRTCLLTFFFTYISIYNFVAHYLFVITTYRLDYFDEFNKDAWKNVIFGKRRRSEEEIVKVARWNNDRSSNEIRYRSPTNRTDIFSYKLWENRSVEWLNIKDKKEKVIDYDDLENIDDRTFPALISSIYLSWWSNLKGIDGS